jgi:murein DD-endopeptidase MepM/ murein hydrolase activator NlpD
VTLGAGAFLSLLLGLTAPARAQLELPPLPLPTLPIPLPPLLPQPSAPPTVAPAAPPPASGPATVAPGPAAPAAPKPAGPAPQLPRCGGRSLPAKGRYTPPGNSRNLVSKAQPLFDLGLSRDRVMEFVTPPFPVAGQAKYSDDWQNPRYTPCFHLHEGTDIFAAEGTPVVAPGPGVVVAFGDHPVGGLSVWLMTDDKISFFMCHLTRFADGLEAGQRVTRSTVLGYVGDTGNAEGGAPHLHFEVHPPVLDKSGQPSVFGIDRSPEGLGQTRTPPTNPKPYLDKWLAEAEGRADSLVEVVIQRGGVLPNDPNSLASLAYSVLAADQSLGFLSKPANQGMAVVALLMGGGALAHTAGVIGKGARSRRRLRRKKGDPAASYFEQRRMAESEAARLAALQAAEEGNLHRRRFRRGGSPGNI